MKKIIILFFVVLAVGCMPTEHLIEQHPEWPNDTVELIREGRISNGMDFEQVRAAWGNPMEVTRQQSYGTTFETWRFGYNADTYRWVYFENGVVSGWHI